MIELGFPFCERVYIHAPLSPKQRININTYPTEEHCDPEPVSLNQVTEHEINDECAIVPPGILRNHSIQCLFKIDLIEI